jgi:nicotinamidase-related amidase
MVIFNVQSQHREKNQIGEYIPHTVSIEINSENAAILLVDFWDQHWCKGANERAAPLMDRANQLLPLLRDNQFFIFHCPSETMDAYQLHPAYLRFINQFSKHEKIKFFFRRNTWKREQEFEKPFPIDASDGGCTDNPPCRQWNPWRAQNARIMIDEKNPKEFISDNGNMIHEFFKKNDIHHLIYIGVHTNMCILGRPFGIRWMKIRGFSPILVRDLTDTMYNPARPPYVSHDEGTALVVAHIEKFWGSTITGVDLEDALKKVA